MIKIPTKVLIVDDEADFVEIFSLRLKEMEQKVDVAYSGEEALTVLQNKPDIDVVILDIKMPGMDGMETLARIKQDHPLVEVILLTGHGTIETAVAGMKQGAYDYLLKPADIGDVTAKLNGARERKEEQEERIRKAEQKSLLRRSGDIY